MQGASLFEATLQRANLSNAKMQGTKLFVSRMEGASLKGAQMQGADIWLTWITEETILINANFKGSALSSVGNTTILKMRAHWGQIFADGTVQTPDDERPAHWPTERLEYNPQAPEDSPFHIEYHKWLFNPASYTPPKPGTPD
jgi:hypothetical protein